MKRWRGRGSAARHRRKRDAVYREQRTPQFPGQDAPIGPCPNEGCSKLAYETRPQADRSARRLYPEKTMRLYRCGRWWHMTSQDAETTERGRRATAVLPDTTNEEDDGER